MEWDQQKTYLKKGDPNPAIPIITLNVNGLNSFIKQEIVKMSIKAKPNP